MFLKQIGIATLLFVSLSVYAQDNEKTVTNQENLIRSTSDTNLVASNSEKTKKRCSRKKVEQTKRHAQKEVRQAIII